MRIVAFLFRRVGDSFMAQPALRALKQQWPAARLTVIPDAGHSALEPPVRRALVAAVERFRHAG